MPARKYEYVTEFETHEKCLPDCWIVVRIEGVDFPEFLECHNIHDPDDIGLINVMNSAAKHIMEEFSDVLLAYGQRNEYNFVLRKTTKLYNRRIQKLASIFTGTFAANFVINWTKFFPSNKLSTTPLFDANVITYPGDASLKDYLSWRVAEGEINDLFRTCWFLVVKRKLADQQALEKPTGIVSSEIIEILNSDFGIHYDDDQEFSKKATVIIKRSPKKLDTYVVDIIGNRLPEEELPEYYPSSSEESTLEDY